MIAFSHGELWSAYIDSFRQAFKASDLTQAERMLDLALADAEDMGELDDRIVWSAHCLASIYHASGALGRAETVYRRVLEVREKLLGSGHPDVADSLGKVAMISPRLRRNSGRPAACPTS